MICEETLKRSGLLPSQSAREREKPAIISFLQKGDTRPILLERLIQGKMISGCFGPGMYKGGYLSHLLTSALSKGPEQSMRSP